MKIKFRDIRLNRANKLRLEVINEIIEDYQEQGYVLTLRQLYYQLVSRDVVPNKASEYTKLSTLLKEGRMGGYVDWNAIEDRLRRPSKPVSFESPQEILDAAIAQFELPRMKGQSTYIEVWVEKDALSGVLKRATEPFHIPILVNRGYSSVSAMYDAYRRFYKALIANQKIVILYLGDFDPSGMDMIRDIEDRTLEFLQANENNLFKVLDWEELDDYIKGDFINNYWLDEDATFENRVEWTQWAKEDYEKLTPARIVHKIKEEGLFKVVPIALTKAQIKQYNPPPNPAKITDPRADKFIDEHGATSWEVDALPPEILNQIVTTNIRNHIDFEVYKSVVESEKEQTKKLKSLTKHLK